VAHGHDLAHFAASAQIFLGLTLAQQGHPDEGVERMREGLAAYLATGAQTSRARVTAQLAEQLGRIGRVEEGLKILEEEIDATGSARYFLAELYRVQGELLLHRNETAPAGAESCFRQAIAVAQGQRAKSLELRAVTSLCRCWQQQGRVDEARQVLAETYQWFHEGLETEDLKDARVLLSPV
jgi:predicted ATPase